MCDFDYTVKEHLRNHLKGYQTSAFLCDHCNKKFCRKRHLEDHVCDRNGKKSHTANSEKRSP